MLYKVSDLFDLTHTRAAELLEKCEYPHEVLPRIKPFILALGETLPISEFLHPSPTVWIARDAVVAPTACLGECIIIDHGAEVRHCAYIRGSALIGRDAVVGNSTELKNVILFDNVQVPHYNYVGDSVLGYRAHMGAGAVTSNVKGDRQPVVVHRGSERMETGLKKLGAMLREANQSIPREVILSDCVYEFTRENPQIRRVPESMLQKEKHGRDNR